MNATKNKSGWIVAGLLLAILMASMDNTIVATAMGTIVGELGGLNHFVWVTAAYMVEGPILIHNGSIPVGLDSSYSGRWRSLRHGPGEA